MKISIVTATYNRKDSLQRSLDSALSLLHAGKVMQLIVVDDCSTDGTGAFIRDRYHNFLMEGRILYKYLETNMGVSSAKNIGCQLSNTEWITFLDSDDEFTTDAGEGLQWLVSNIGKNFQLIFARCINSNTKQQQGPQRSPGELSLAELLNYGTPGECLPIVRRDLILQFPFPEELRGSEGLSYLEMLYSGKKCYLSDRNLRLYNTDSESRLSSFGQRLKRSKQLGIHHLRLVKYWSEMSPKTRALLCCKILIYFCMSIVRPKL
jgi:glycosyltransferase involved in cell wall biosynthesis